MHIIYWKKYYIKKLVIIPKFSSDPVPLGAVNDAHLSLQVHEFERKKRIRPTQKDIDNMDLFDYGRYLVRKDAGFYDDNNTSESEGGSVDVVN